MPILDGALQRDDKDSISWPFEDWLNAVQNELKELFGPRVMKDIVIMTSISKGGIQDQTRCGRVWWYWDDCQTTGQGIQICRTYATYASVVDFASARSTLTYCSSSWIFRSAVYELRITFCMRMMDILMMSINILGYFWSLVNDMSLIKYEFYTVRVQSMYFVRTPVMSRWCDDIHWRTKISSHELCTESQWSSWS